MTQRWTKEEIELLKTVYPIEGGKAIRHFPNRTIKALGVQASKHGISANNKKPVYTDENFESAMEPLGWKPLDEYGGICHPMNFMCLICDHVIYSQPRYVIHGSKKCDNCSRLNREKKYIEFLKDTDFELLEPYKGAQVRTLHKHSVCGTEWHTRPHDIKCGTGCPACEGKNATKVYCLYFPELEVYKIGISNNPERRSKEFGYKANIVWVEECGTYDKAKEREIELLSKVELKDTGMLRSGNKETFIELK